MADTLEQTEHAAAELLARGFNKTWQNGAAPKPTRGAAICDPLSLPTPILGAPSNHQPVVITTSASKSTPASLQPVSSNPNRNAAMLNSRNRNPVSPRGRGARGAMPLTTTGPSGLHPVVRLGWTPLCSVVCNGLRGEFLGGHDRDMFIRVTSGQYQGLPMMDASLGGCIMTCSQFERCAGRELSKKWKESIHVVGEGEGSRATLLSWLKRKADQDFGDGVVGKKVWVCWCADAEYYQGTVVSYNREGGKHTVQYSTRLAEELHLPVELISFDVDKPMVPSPQGPAASAPPAVHETIPPMSSHQTTTIVPGANAGAGAGGGGLSGPATKDIIQLGGGVGGVGITTTPQLWHQGSGISVTSSYAEELRGNAALTALATGVRKGLRTGQRRSRALVRVAEEAGVVAEMPPPKRALSAPAAVLLAEVAAAAAAMEKNAQAAAGHAAHALGGSGGTVSPITPGRPIHAALPVSSLVMPLPSPPQGAGAVAASPEGLSAAIGWMHDLALSLDNELDAAEHAVQTNAPRAGTFSMSTDGVTTTGAPTTAAGARINAVPMPSLSGPGGSASAGLSFSVPTVSVSGRFQALLGLLRNTPACLEGLYEGMVRRFEFFAATPPVQRRKMAEFLVAAVVEASAHRDLFKTSSTPARSGSPSLPNSQSHDHIKGGEEGAVNAPITTAGVAGGAAEHGDGSTHTAVPHNNTNYSPMKF